MALSISRAIMKWPICGPKLSLCCSVISVWGIIQFLLLGIFFFVQAAPLLDDFAFESKNTTDINAFNTALKDAYHQRAYNCWIAAILYIALLIFAGLQFMTNLKNSPAPNVPTPIASPFAGVTTEENGYNQQYGIQFPGDQNTT
jgi:ribonuclease kappa